MFTKNMEFGTYFIASQAARLIAMVFDFLSFQYKKRELMFLMLIISSALISSHYFLLGRIAAGFIVMVSVLRFTTCYFTTDKRWLYIFLILNAFIVLFRYNDIYDLIILFGMTVFIIGNFQKDDRKMRKMMMVGTSAIVLYNLIIFSPMGFIGEALFLGSNFIGYYRHFLRKTGK